MPSHARQEINKRWLALQDLENEEFKGMKRIFHILVVGFHKKRALLIV